MAMRLVWTVGEVPDAPRAALVLCGQSVVGQGATRVAPCRSRREVVSLMGWTLIEVIDVAAARRALAGRMLRCPDCGAVLAPWGHASARTVYDLDGARVSVRPDRARCTGCAATHVLLDAALLARRGYAVRVVGHALVRAARGETHRTIADQLDAPLSTVRGWIRRARRTSHRLWTLGVAAVVALDQDAVPTRERSDPLGAALDALAAAAFAVRRRFGSSFREPWSTITVLTHGRLLAPASTG